MGPRLLTDYRFPRHHERPCSCASSGGAEQAAHDPLRHGLSKGCKKLLRRAAAAWLAGTECTRNARQCQKPSNQGGVSHPQAFHGVEGQMQCAVLVLLPGGLALLGNLVQKGFDSMAVSLHNLPQHFPEAPPHNYRRNTAHSSLQQARRWGGSATHFAAFFSLFIGLKESTLLVRSTC